MRKILNTLYVTTDDAWLHQDGANVVLRVEGAERARLPLHMLEGIVCIGRIGVSTPLLGRCATDGIQVCFLTATGRFLARVEGPTRGNVLLRRSQYRVTDLEEACGPIVRNLLVGKVSNQRTVLMRALREAVPPAGDIEDAQLRLRRIVDSIRREERLDVLRGLEGEAAAIYFGVFDRMILATDPLLRFTRRSRRPPADPINALLSFLYTLMTHDCRSALEVVGLDPAVGFLHRDRPGRPSLALDLAEELRAVVCDRLAIAMINRRQLSTREFCVVDGLAASLTEAGRKAVLRAYHERKQETVQHAFIGESIHIGLLPYVQALLLARHLRGDLDAYPPLLWR